MHWIDQFMPFIAAGEAAVNKVPVYGTRTGELKILAKLTAATFIPAYVFIIVS